LIVSLAGPEPKVESFLINRGKVQPEPIVIVD